MATNEESTTKRPKLGPTSILNGPQDSISTSFDPREWTTVESVTLSKCLQSLTPDLIALNKDTLTQLTFSDYTLFKNIKRCLKTLTNLKHLSFIDVFIDAYHRFLYTKTIEAPSIESLTLTRSTKITNSEYFLLDFFTRGANLSNLTKFDLIVAAASDETVGSCENGNTADLVQEDTSFLARFLLKHRSTLRHLRVFGSGTKIWDAAETREQTTSNLGAIQLSEFWFTMDDPGQCFILERQRILKNFTWEGVSKEWDKKKLDQLFVSLANNADTLSYIKLVPVLLISTIEEKEDDESLEISCEELSKLTHLDSLEIDIKVTNRSSKSQSASLISVHNVPSGLQLLVLHSSEFSPQELQLLMGRIAEFLNLETFQLHADPPQGSGRSSSKDPSFEFSSVWLQALAELPEIREVVISGGVLKSEEIENTIAHLKHSKPNFNVRLD